MEEKTDTKKEFLLGKAPIQTYNKSLILNMLFLLAAVFISMLLYEDEFILGERQISHLDNLSHNPIGLWVFKFGFILAGLWFLPNALNLARNVRKSSPFLGVITGFFYILSSLGMIIVAFFPVRVSYPMHIVGAGLGFGSLVLAIVFSLVIFIRKTIKNYSPKTFGLLILFYSPLLIVVILGIINIGIPEIQSLQAGIPFGDFTPEGWEYYEWGLFFVGLYSTVGTQFLLQSE